MLYAANNSFLLSKVLNVWSGSCKGWVELSIAFYCAIPPTVHCLSDLINAYHVTQISSTKQKAECKRILHKIWIQPTTYFSRDPLCNLQSEIAPRNTPSSLITEPCLHYEVAVERPCSLQATGSIVPVCLSVCRAYSTICGKINKSLQNCPQGGLTSVGDEAGRSCRWCTCVMCLIAATELLLSVDLCLCTNCVTVTGGVLQLQWRTSCFVIRIKCLCLSGWWNPVGQMGGACCCYVREKCIHCAGWTVCVRETTWKIQMAR